MSEPNRSREREHWQAIAEQLGLAPEPENPAGSEACPREPVAMKGAKQSLEPPAAAVEPEERSREERPPPRGRPRRSGRADDGRPPRVASGRPPVAKPATEGPGAAEERPAPRQGRGRRSPRPKIETGREHADATVAAESSSEGPGEAGAPPLAERSARPGRGRGRQQKPKAVVAKEKAPIAAEIRQPKPLSNDTDDAELDDVRSLTNWNVPSWNELIASLYRPER